MMKHAWHCIIKAADIMHTWASKVALPTPEQVNPEPKRLKCIVVDTVLHVYSALVHVRGVAVNTRTAACCRTALCTLFSRKQTHTTELDIPLESSH